MYPRQPLSCSRRLLQTTLCWLRRRQSGYNFRPWRYQLLRTTRQRPRPGNGVCGDQEPWDTRKWQESPLVINYEGTVKPYRTRTFETASTPTHTSLQLYSCPDMRVLKQILPSTIAKGTRKRVQRLKSLSYHRPSRQSNTKNTAPEKSKDQKLSPPQLVLHRMLVKEE